MGKVLQIASFSYAEVKYSTGDIGQEDQLNLSFQIRENAKIASLKVKARQENVSGTMLPSFDMVIDGGNGKRQGSINQN